MSNINFTFDLFSISVYWMQSYGRKRYWKLGFL